MSSKETITMVKPDDHTIWKLDMLAKSSKTVFENKEKIGRTVESSSIQPEWLVKVMMKIKENVYDLKPIIVRTLWQTDLNIMQSRLLIPSKQLQSLDFLTEEESRILYEQSKLKIRKEGLSVVLVDPGLRTYEVKLRRWKVGGNLNYVVAGGWNKVVKANKFKAGDVTRIWSFRYGRGKLCLALSPVEKDSQGESSSRRS